MSRVADDDEKLKFIDHITRHDMTPPHRGGVNGWRHFIDGDNIVLEPPNGEGVDHRTMQHILQWTEVRRLEAVFRTTPRPGVYLQFCLMKRGS